MSTTGEQYGYSPPEHRLPSGMRLGRVSLQVSDLDRSLDFYENVLGLSALDPDGDALSLGVLADGEPLVDLVERPGARPVPPRGRLGLYHFAILLPDRPALGRFVGHLAELQLQVGASDHLVSEALYLQDPDGLGIEVYADRPRASWKLRGDELAMDSLPLDVRSLTQAAAGKRWEGLPSGSSVGHVHLHVGELERAREFYHEGLGLDAVVWSYPGALFLSAGGYHHHLGVNTWAAGAEPAGEGDARLLDWEIVLPTEEDVASAVASLRRVGAEVEERGNAHLTSDPWGTNLRLVSGLAGPPTRHE